MEQQLSPKSANSFRNRLIAFIGSAHLLNVILGIALATQVIQNQILIRRISVSPSSSVFNPGSALENIQVSIPPLTTLDGHQYEIGSNSSVRHLLIFFHTECRYCKADIPLWKKLSQNAVERKIDIVAITLEVDTETVSRFSQEHQFGFPILIDRGGRVFDLLGIAATPSKVLLSEDMKVVNMWRGLVSQSARPADIISLSAVFGVANDDLPILPGD